MTPWNECVERGRHIFDPDKPYAELRCAHCGQHPGIEQVQKARRLAGLPVLRVVEVAPSLDSGG